MFVKVVFPSSLWWPLPQSTDSTATLTGNDLVSVRCWYYLRTRDKDMVVCTVCSGITLEPSHLYGFLFS